MCGFKSRNCNLAVESGVCWVAGAQDAISMCVHHEPQLTSAIAPLFTIGLPRGIASAAFYALSASFMPTLTLPLQQRAQVLP